MNFEKLLSKGYSFEQELLYRCFLKGAKIGESPIIFVNRSSGVSKVNWWEALRSITLLIYLGIVLKKDSKELTSVIPGNYNSSA